MKQWWLLYLKLPWDKRVLWTSAALSAMTISLCLLKPADAPEPSRGAPFEVDTRIPRGFVLVPIEAQNYEALDSILGRFGVVDLYRPQGPDAAERRLAARNVRILRAPQNPSHFAVLIPESEAGRLMAAGAVFTVIVKRAGSTGTAFEKASERPRREIIYGGG